jgi:hypothetical protein
MPSLNRSGHDHQRSRSGRIEFLYLHSVLFDARRPAHPSVPLTPLRLERTRSRFGASFIDSGSVRVLVGFDDLLRRCAADGQCGCSLGRPDLHQHLVAARDPTG